VAQLQIGDEVKLQTYTVNNVTYVSFIEVTKLADQNNAQFTVNGTLNYFGSNGQGKNIINITTQQNGVPVAVQYEVANNFSLITNGLEFKPGCTVELSIQNMQVNKIEIKVSAPSAS
jgi:hypothetical protein